MQPGVLVKDLITPHGNHVVVILQPVTIATVKELQDELLEAALEAGM